MNVQLIDNFFDNSHLLSYFSSSHTHNTKLSLLCRVNCFIYTYDNLADLNNKSEEINSYPVDLKYKQKRISSLLVFIVRIQSQEQKTIIQTDRHTNKQKENKIFNLQATIYHDVSS